MNELSKEITELLKKESTIEFLAAARQFIKLVENSNLSNELFYKESHKSLATLYQTALNLENVDLIYSGPESEFKGINKDELRKQNIKLISKLGKDSVYWEVFDPTYTEDDGKPGNGWKLKDKEPSQGWLVDDFADIYADLKEEINKIDEIGTDESIEDALWQLKFGFNHHWGNHCINAMRALHFLWYDGKTAM
jgi:sugar phosphate isomerase/epimerase